MKFAPLTRILLRYLAMYIALKGFLPEDLAVAIAEDPDILAIFNIAVGAALAGVNEAWYALAKKYNWAT